MAITRKKIKKNLPYLFIFLAIAAIVSYRAYTQMHPTHPPDRPLTAEDKYFLKHKIASAPYYSESSQFETLPLFSFVEIGSISNNEKGGAVFTPARKVPAPGERPIYPVLTIKEPLPTVAEIGHLAAEAIAPWRAASHDIDGVFIRYEVEKPDFDVYGATAKTLKKNLGSINLVLKRSWFTDTPTSAIAVKNAGKYSRIFAYDMDEAGRKDETLSQTIAKLEENRLSFFLIVDQKPDLLALKSEIGDQDAFMGIVYRKDNKAVEKTNAAEDQK